MKRLFAMLLALCLLLTMAPIALADGEVGEEAAEIETPAETGEPGAETPSVEEEETLPEEPLETEPADTEPAETAPAETEPAASEPAEAVSEAIEEELVAAAPAR